MRFLVLVLILSFMIFLNESQTVSITLPVPQKIIARVTLSIQKLENSLKNFGTIFENKAAISKRVELTKSYLNQLSQALARYNNVIVGTGSAVNGSKNLVLGNYNDIEGSSNWVFVSQYTGEINGDLLVGQWRIQLDKSELIPKNTRFAISFLNQARNTEVKNKYFSKGRDLCKWDKWTNPNNTKSNGHWGRYRGYNQWKAKALQSGNTTNL